MTRGPLIGGEGVASEGLESLTQKFPKNSSNLPVPNVSILFNSQGKNNSYT